MNTFGLSATDLSPQDLLALAESCHNVNRAYVLATAAPAPLESPDPATLPWEELDKAGRDVVLEGVVFHVKNPDATPAASHANWMRAKQAQRGSDQIVAIDARLAAWAVVQRRVGGGIQVNRTP